MKEIRFDAVKLSKMLKTHAVYFWTLGFEVVPVEICEIEDSLVENYKNPWKKERNLALNTFKGLVDEPEMYFNFNWESTTGLGAISGRNDIRCLDIDNCSNQGFIYTILAILGLPRDYEWVVKSGSHKGFHIWIKLDQEPVLNYLDEFGSFNYNAHQEFEEMASKIELRWNKSFTVLPPSIHMSGNSYYFINTDLPSNPPTQVSAKTLFTFLNTFWFGSEDTKEHIYQQQLVDYKLFSPSQFIYNGNSECIVKNDAILFFDIETTGLPIEYDADFSDSDKWPFIVQLAWSLCTKSGTEEFTLKNKQDRDYVLDCTNIDIPQEAQAVHGISNEMARSVKNTIPRMLILKFFSQLISNCKIVVCHNTDFDVNVLRAEFSRNGIYDPFFSNEIEVRCTMKETTNYCNLTNQYGNLKWPTLMELYGKVFGRYQSNSLLILSSELDEDDWHNAEFDVKVLKNCFEKLVQDGVLDCVMRPEYKY